MSCSAYGYTIRFSTSTVDVVFPHPVDHITAKSRAEQVEDHKSFWTFSSMPSSSAPSTSVV